MRDTHPRDDEPTIPSEDGTDSRFHALSLDMFQAFFDESEFEAVFLIAGWVTTSEEWTKFDAAWNAELSADPVIQYFSHHDAKMLKGEFEGWSGEAAQAKLAALVKVICDHEMYGVFSHRRCSGDATTVGAGPHAGCRRPRL